MAEIADPSMIIADTSFQPNSPIDRREARIVIINSLQESIFIRKFIGQTVTVAINRDFTAFAVDNNTVFVYPNKIARSTIVDIFQDSNVLKLVSKPLPALNSYLSGINYANCLHISSYINEKGDSRVIPEMKRELINQDVIKRLDERAANVALIMMKYKMDADTMIKPEKENNKKKSYFNNNRDCYLLYLTAYNDILSNLGPMRFPELTQRVRRYPYLCRAGLHPATALEGLIRVGALSSNHLTTVISIPDQIPQPISIKTPSTNK